MHSKAEKQQGGQKVLLFLKKEEENWQKKAFLNLNNKTDLKIKWTVNSTKAETFVVV